MVTFTATSTVTLMATSTAAFHRDFYDDFHGDSHGNFYGGFHSDFHGNSYGDFHIDFTFEGSQFYVPKNDALTLTIQFYVRLIVRVVESLSFLYLCVVPGTYAVEECSSRFLHRFIDFHGIEKHSSRFLNRFLNIRVIKKSYRFLSYLSIFVLSRNVLLDFCVFGKCSS